MASVVGSSPSPGPFESFPRSSPYRVRNDYDAFRDATTSYDQNVDLAATAHDPIGFGFNDFFGGGGGDDMLNTALAGQASLPVSNNPAGFGFFIPLDDPVLASTTVEPSHSALTSTCFGQRQQSHAFPDARPPYTAPRHFPAITIPTGPHDGAWAYGGLPDLDFTHLATAYSRESQSTCSGTNYSPDQDPWSPVQHRAHGSLASDLNSLGPPLDPQGDYAQSVLSWQSSPTFQIIRTPSSSRSPLSSHANLSRGPQSPVNAPAAQLDIIPRSSPNPSGRSMNTASSFEFTKTEPVSPLRLAASSLSVDRASNLDPPISPSTSDFVFVNSHGADRAASPPPPDRQEWLATSSSRHRQSPPGVLTQVFTTKEHGSSRSSSSGAIRKSATKRAGGRSVGSHLSPDKAARAKQLREEGCCWLCCLQRDSCTPGEVCERCSKRAQRATLEHGLGCDRTKLTELKAIFIPDVITRLHEHSALKTWCGQHIRRWSGTQIKLKVHIIWSLPPIECELYEFEPRTPELLHEYQWRTNPETGKLQRFQKACPPLAMVQIEQNDRQRYDRYLNRIVDNHLERFAEICFKGVPDDFQTRLLKMMVRLKPESKEEAALLREIFRLLVVTHIMSRKATLAPSQRTQLSTLHSYPGGADAYGWATSPRIANRQLKFLWCSLLTGIMDSVLKKLQQILRSSKGGAKWTPAFCSVLGLAMCFEYIQRIVHVVCDDPSVQGNSTVQSMECTAEATCRLIDEKFQFISNLFRWKYHRGFNPLKDWMDDKVQQTLGPNAVEFVRSVTGLVVEKYETFLFERQHVGISTANQHKYTSRLVAQFLISFWSPQ